MTFAQWQKGKTMRLIDADALEAKLEEQRKLYIDMDMKGAEHLLVHDVLHHVWEAPTIDAVQVIRCKDCKHRDPEDKKCDCGHDIQWQLPRDDDWFCADGERKDND